MDSFLIIDGNSLINRAFFGIKLLTAKDGHYTNAIYGFMNMFLHLTERTRATHIAVAFDLKAPTFRHKQYAEYKAGRKPMPPELFEQMEPLKEILRAYGCHVVTCEGFEADDILGTLSHTAVNAHSYIATGDRDSLQLVSGSVTVLLTTTKMGQTVTTEYTPETLFKEYGVTPEGMIEIKALQGDSSDNIPGVAGIGPKTAGDLIRRYGTIDRIYASLDTLEVSSGVREKLRAGQDSAYLSRALGTISLKAPIDTATESYRLRPRDDQTLRALLTRHEMFKLIGRLGLTDAPKKTASEKEDASVSAYTLRVSPAETILIPENAEICVYFGEKDDAVLLVDRNVYYFKQNADDVFRLLVSAAKNGCRWTTSQTKAIYRRAGKGVDGPALPAFDLPLAAYLLNPNTSDYSNEALALLYHVEAPAVTAAADADGLCIEEDAVRKALLMPGLRARLSSLLQANGQYELLTEIEIPLARVLAEMELDGMAVDRAAIEAYSGVLQKKADEAERQIFAAAGETFNVNSPKQLGVILFEKLKLPCKKKTKTGYSTNAEVLEALAEDFPIAATVLAYRTYAKLKSTYCDGLLKAIGPDGRVRSTFNQTETRTGRLSSTEPNLQNIPVRTEVGREFRKFFVAEEGARIVDADYSQIELRVLAALSGDKNMIDCFNHNLDIHTQTAAKVFGIPEEAVTSELRSKAKAVNFGIVYGIGAFSLSKDIHTTRAEAERFIEAYLSLYANVDGYMKRSIDQAKRNGWAETLYHRRRYLPELNASNPMLRAFGERVARNMPIQGTAADIIKIAMIRVRDRLKAELPQSRLIMQVHDELIIEAPTAQAQKAAALLKEEMENAVSLAVKLKTDVGVGKTWYDAKG